MPFLRICWLTPGSNEYPWYCIVIPSWKLIWLLNDTRTFLKSSSAVPSTPAPPMSPPATRSADPAPARLPHGVIVTPSGLSKLGAMTRIGTARFAWML